MIVAKNTFSNSKVNIYTVRRFSTYCFCQCKKLFKDTIKYKNVHNQISNKITTRNLSSIYKPLLKSKTINHSASGTERKDETIELDAEYKQDEFDTF